MIGRLHGGWIHPRRARVLSRLLAALMPEGARVLDVGCGDGRVASLLLRQRPDLEVRGLEVGARAATLIPVEEFDGRTLPSPDAGFDVVLFVDVLHHTDDPQELLREGARVARRCLVIKDHLLQGPLARATLRFMDRVGNARHGVALPYNYWTPARWRQAFASLGLRGSWETRLGLYPWPASWVFGRSLHFLARLDVPAGGDD